MSQFFDRVRNKLPGSQADTDPHHWRLPPASSYKPGVSHGKKLPRQTLIPNPKLLRNAFIPIHPEAGLEPAGTGAGSFSSDDAPVYPDVSHAALHLALLECFRGLHRSADALDIDALRSHTTRHALTPPPETQPPTYCEKPKLLELSPSDSATAAATATATTSSADPQSTQKWDLLARLAVDRFGLWWRAIAKVLQHAAAYTHLRHRDAAVQLGDNYLPPLDVLLVWYVFMLHGGGDAYASACRDHRDVPRLQHLCFPWEALRTAVDTDAQCPADDSSPASGFAYNLPRAAQALFRTLTSQDADVTAYLEKPPPYAEHHSPVVFDGIDLYDEVRSLFTSSRTVAHPIASAPSFVEEAHELLWIRSPSLVGTLTRNSRHYFDSLLGGRLDCNTAPSDPAGDIGHVPFGVELMWRTHRLYPIQYRLFYEAKLGQLSSGQRLVPVDDSPLRGGFDGGIEEDPAEGFGADTLQNSNNIRSSGNGSVVSLNKPICQCWTCERIRDDAPDFAYYPASASHPAALSWPVSPIHSAAAAAATSSASSPAFVSSSSSSVSSSSPSSSSASIISSAGASDPIPSSSAASSPSFPRRRHPGRCATTRCISTG
ncbi:hypothetical protein MN608_07785 [Microdochium nivale]|nr:hypothetical protein MN608_07785 [Microdochium nivale]